MDPGAPGPNAGRRRRTRRRTRTQRTTSRLRRTAPAIQGSADRSAGRRGGPGRSAGHECGTAPNVGGTAEGRRPFVPEETNWSFSDSRAPTASEPPTDEGTNRMTDPLSLNEVKRLAGSADTILLRATRTADLETPIGAFLRLEDGITPAYLLESVEGGERLGRYSFLGVGPRRLLEVRDGLALTTTRPVGVVDYAPDLPVTETATPDPLAALRAFAQQRKVLPTDGMPRFTGGAVGALSY